MRLILAFLCVFQLESVFAIDHQILTVDAKATQFTVSLPANPTTGYRWTIKTYDQTLFKLIHQSYLANEPRRIGSGGHTDFVFQRVKGQSYPKKARMIFNYQRPWVKDSDTGSIQEVTVLFK